MASSVIAREASSSRVNSTATDATWVIRADSGIAVPASDGCPLPFQAVSTLCRLSATLGGRFSRPAAARATSHVAG